MQSVNALHSARRLPTKAHPILSSMSPLGLEPRTHGLKGRCSTN